MRFFLLLGILTASLSFFACSTPQSGTPPSPREERDYKDVFTLFSKNAYESTIARAQSFAKRYPKSTQLAQVENLQGLALLATQHPAAAAGFFKKAINDNQELGGNAELEPYLLYNLANAQFEANQLEESSKTIGRIRMDDLDKENRIKATYLRARILGKQNQPANSAADALAVGKLLGATQGDNRNAVSALLDQDLALITDAAVLEDLARGHEDSPLVDQVLFRLGSVELSRGNRAGGNQFLNTLKTRFPESPYYAKAVELMRGGDVGNVPPAAGAVVPTAGARDTGPVNSSAIGVLLPMKGKFSKFGQRSLQGIELAFRIFNLQEPDSKVTLVVEDSGDDADSAVRGLERLVRRHHVVGVIGPLLSKGVDQVTQRAQELGVPLLSLARHHGVEGDYVFQAGLTLRLQTQEIARYAVQQLGFKRFAILYPRDKVGEETAQKFWDAAEALGASITGYESYNPGETDFRQPVDKLSGLYYTEARAKELEAMAKDRETNKIKKRTRKTEQYFSLKPVVDYDAVFIPEEPKAAGQILPTFAYRDVDHVKFLGTSAWNTPELIARAQAQVQNAYFLDAFYPESPSAATRKYVERYRATFNQDPSAMDALAYDAARLLEAILNAKPEISREGLRDRLRETKNFPGVTGRISFQDGHLGRNLMVLTAKGDKIVMASGAGD